MVQPVDISNVLNSLQLLGQSNRYLAEKERERKAKQSAFLGQLGGIGGSVVGGYFGGPYGAAAGGAVGSALGQRAGGGEPNAAQVGQSAYQGYQMGANQQQQQNNQRFNTELSNSISGNPDATTQQKQYADFLKGSNQDPNVSMRQAQYLGVDPQSIRQQSINQNINTRTIDSGISNLRTQQAQYGEDTTEYQGIQTRINRLETLKNNKSLGFVPSSSIENQVRKEVPPQLEIYQREGKILARETDSATGKTKTISLGNAQTGKEGLYKVPYYDQNGKLKIQNYTDRDKAVNFANEKGSEVLGENKSVFLNSINAAAKEKKDIDYRITNDLSRKRENIIKRLTRKGPAGETILPQETQVDEAYLKELNSLTRTSTGREKTLIGKERNYIASKITENRKEATDNFISSLEEANPDVATVDANIKLISERGVPPGVNKKKVLDKLKSIRSQRLQSETAQQEKIAQEEESRKLQEQLRKEEVERKKRELGYTPWIEYKGERIL